VDFADLKALPFVIEAKEFPWLRMLKLGQNLIAILDVDPKKPFDPVVGVRSGSRSRSHLHEPWPDTLGRHIYGNRSSRLESDVCQDVIAGHRSLRFLTRRAEIEDSRAHNSQVCNGRRSDQSNRTNGSSNAGSSEVLHVSMILVAPTTERLA
jgi:hypothetical protein